MALADLAKRAIRKRTQGREPKRGLAVGQSNPIGGKVSSCELDLCQTQCRPVTSEQQLLLAGERAEMTRQRPILELPEQVALMDEPPL